MDISLFNEKVHEIGRNALTHFTGVEISERTSSTESEDELPFPVLGHWMASILVATPVLKLTLKVHYSLPDLPIPSLQQEVAIANPEDHPVIAREFGKELLNWWGGLVRRGVDPMGKDSNLGLPVTTRGFDEIFSRRSNGRDCFFSATTWRYRDESRISMTTLLELQSPEAFKAWSWPEAGDKAALDTAGEIEFI